MVSINLYSENTKELQNFLSSFYNSSFDLNNSLTWEHKYKNPIEIAEIIGIFVDNSDKFNIAMWVSIDNGVYIKISENNADNLIKYLFERYPY